MARAWKAAESHHITTYCRTLDPQAQRNVDQARGPQAKTDVVWRLPFAVQLRTRQHPTWHEIKQGVKDAEAAARADGKLWGYLAQTGGPGQETLIVLSASAFYDLLQEWWDHVQA